MNKIAACLMLSTCLLMAPAASATWGSFISTGSATGIGNPSCASVSTEEVACAVRSGKSAMMVNEFNGTAWGAWKSLTGTVSSDPSCTSDGSGKVLCAATATNGDLEVTVVSGGVWSNPTNVTAALFSAPSCAQYTAGQVLCVARNASGKAMRVEDGQRFEALFDALVRVTQALLEAQHFLADDLETKVPGLDDAGVNRADRNLVHAVAAHPYERVILLARFPLGRRFEIAAQRKAVDRPRGLPRPWALIVGIALHAVQIVSRTLHPVRHGENR